MISVAPFAGSAGDTLRDFLSLRGLVRLIPRLVVCAVLGAAGLWLSARLRLSLPAQVLVAWVFVSPVLASQALGKRHGNDVVAADLVGFVVRLILLTGTWGLPAAIVLQRFIGPETWPTIGVMMPAAWPQVIVLCIAGVVLLIGTQVSLVMATLCDTTAELLQPERWDWALFERRRDLAPLLAVLLGGVALFYLMVLPASLGAAAVIVRVHARAGIAVALFGLLSPTVFGAMLAAKLAGAFAAQRDEEFRKANMPKSKTVRTESHAPPLEPARVIAPQQLMTPAPRRRRRRPVTVSNPSLPGAGAMHFIRELQALSQLAEEDLDSAIADAESMLDEQPQSAGVMAALAKLYRKAGRDDDAISTAAGAITTALNGGMSPVAIDIFGSFSTQKRRLNLSAALWSQLGVTLRAQGHDADADWCQGRAEQPQ